MPQNSSVLQNQQTKKSKDFGCFSLGNVVSE